MDAWYAIQFEQPAGMEAAPSRTLRGGIHETSFSSSETLDSSVRIRRRDETRKRDEETGMAWRGKSTSRRRRKLSRLIDACVVDVDDSSSNGSE